MEENVDVLKIVKGDGYTCVISDESSYYSSKLRGRKIHGKEYYYIDNKPVSNNRKKLIDLIRNRV